MAHGRPDGLLYRVRQPGHAERDLIWDIDRNVVVTRGCMATPEQKTPDQPMPGPWESCYTLGTQWQFKPTNEDYKSGPGT